MTDKILFTDDDKGWLLAALEVKRQQLQRAINQAAAGSSLAKALHTDQATLAALITKVGML